MYVCNWVFFFFPWMEIIAIGCSALGWKKNEGGANSSFVWVGFCLRKNQVKFHSNDRMKRTLEVGKESSDSEELESQY